MKIFITGGTGNIGQYVTLAVIKAGHEAIVLTRNPQQYPSLQNKPGVQLVKGSITDYGLIEKKLSGCDGVIHIALGWGDEPISMLKMDTEATVTLLEMAEKARVKKFIYTSSTAAMGKMRPDMNETMMNLPTDLYGSTKSASEAFVLGFRRYYGNDRTPGKVVSMKRNIIRPGYTFSNPPYPDGVTQSDTRFRDIAEAIVNSKPVVLTKNDGTQFISAHDIAQLYIALLESELNEEVILALANTFTTWEEIAYMALSYYPESTSGIQLVDQGKEPVTTLEFHVDKMKNLFGLSFDSKKDLQAHIQWNIEEAVKNKKRGASM
jgi:UDP-glucose 4-epimerase